MDSNLAVVLVAAVVVVVIAGVLFAQRRRSHRMRDRFGAEYRTAVDEVGSRRQAEAELRRREKRVHGFELQPLSSSEATRLSERWRSIQADFVDNPGRAISDADGLLAEAMQARGYPVADFERRADDLSVEYPQLVSNYRIAHDLAKRHAAGDAGTEDLRRALIHYRALFDEVVHPGVERRAEEPRAFDGEVSGDLRTDTDRDPIDPDDRLAAPRRGDDGRATNI